MSYKKEKVSKIKELQKPLCEVLSSYYLKKDSEEEKKEESFSAKEAKERMDEAETSYKSVMEMQKKLVKVYETIVDKGS